MQKAGFLAAEESVELSVFFQKKLGAGLFGGEGFIMQRLSGQGTAFLEFDGHVVEYNLQPGTADRSGYRIPGGNGRYMQYGDQDCARVSRIWCSAERACLILLSPGRAACGFRLCRSQVWRQRS